MKIIESWYNRLDVKFEMIKFLYNRELAFLDKYDPAKSTRHLKAHNVNFLEKNFEMLKFFQKSYNCFYSLDKFKDGVPMFSFDLTNRNTQHWVMNRYNDVVEHDMLLDFDADSFEAVYDIRNEVARMKELLDGYGVPYSLRYSGKGFHIVIPHKFTGVTGSLNPGDQSNIYSQMIDILNYAAKILDMKSLDVKCTAYGRIMKIPYSLALYPEEETKVCLPLTDDMFDNFDLKMVSPEWVMENIKIQKRGDLMRNGSKTMKELMKEELEYAAKL